MVSRAPALTPAERRLVARLRTPEQVQAWLRRLDYNKEPEGQTLRSFRGVLEHKTAHCLEGALAAAFLLEFHGYPPLLLDLESDDKLDHVVFAYRGPGGRWGAVGKSRFPGLMGRRPLFRSVRDLAWSYVDPFVDFTGRVKGYALFDLRELPGADWRLARGNVWRIERALIDYPHARLRASEARHRYWRARYRAFKRDHPDLEPPASFYRYHDRFM
ncbi:MAG TPA: hypothetical protein VNZ52_15515 [Candidatus Thermoplasmatota archaeon]|nr:hypothetical protein [Candidatus Thermoplasmatota archaeon]